jgi:D-beta-D-heptose 7-phosphate kinase/D-beta-D-heptose 1-phosphate adenosyltransferase
MKVLVLGDSCLDVYRHCEIVKENPEADYPLVRVVRTETRLGMAANVTLGLNSLGIQTHSIYGNQQSVKTRFLDYLRVDEDKVSEPIVVPNLSPYAAVVISDYNKGSITRDTILMVLDIATCKVFLDTKKTDLKGFEKAVIKINSLEASKATGLTTKTIVTCGADGVRQGPYHYPAIKTKVIDVCGAGDAFLVGMIYGHLNRLNCIHSGIVNATIAVRHLGCYAPSKEEWEAEYDKTIR